METNGREKRAGGENATAISPNNLYFTNGNYRFHPTINRPAENVASRNGTKFNFKYKISMIT